MQQAILNKYFLMMEEAERQHKRNNIPKSWTKLELRQMVAANILFGVFLSAAFVCFVLEKASKIDITSKTDVVKLSEDETSVAASQHNFVRVASAFH